MPASLPSEQEVLEYFDSLSNWGRWGKAGRGTGPGWDHRVVRPDRNL